MELSTHFFINQTAKIYWLSIVRKDLCFTALRIISRYKILLDTSLDLEKCLPLSWNNKTKGMAYRGQSPYGKSMLSDAQDYPILHGTNSWTVSQASNQKFYVWLNRDHPV